MRRLFVCLALSVLVAASATARPRSSSEVNRHIDALVEQVERGYAGLEAARYRNAIAVFDLSDESAEAESRRLGVACAQLLTTRLAETGRFFVVERSRLDNLTDEIKLGMAGMVSEKTAARAGKMVGADIVVVGSVSELGDVFNVNIRLVEVESSHIVMTAVEEIDRSLLIDLRARCPPQHIGSARPATSIPSRATRATREDGVALTYWRELSRSLAWEVEFGYGPELQLGDHGLAVPPEGTSWTGGANLVTSGGGSSWGWGERT